MEAGMGVHKKPTHSWWFGSDTGSRRSPWLVATISELEEKTQGMLKLVEEDADSFAKRAEMYYRKRPELVSMIEDFYRAHRSLAERYDQLRLEGGLQRTTSFDSTLSNRRWLQKVRSTADESSKSSLDSFDSEESEVDDPDPEAEVESRLRPVVPNAKGTDSDMVKLISKEVVERLKEENVALKAELAAKDEEKREVIRQLSFSVDILKEENGRMRKCIKDSKKWSDFLDFKKLKKGVVLTGKLFGGFSKSQTTVVAL